jgi:prepilin-type N-terminal cleavage/methylation domain-containing protein
VSDNKQAGFTLVELLVSISVMAIVAVTFVGIISSYFTIISHNIALSEMTVASQNLLRATVENIRYGNGVRQTNQITDPNAPVGGWNTNNSTFVIIISVPALNASRAYIIDPNTGSPYMNELVYYKSGTTLMQRKLANSDATGNTVKTSCPANLATASCPADIQLATNVSNMSFMMYDQDAVQTANTVAARSVKIDLTLRRPAPGNPISVSNSIRVTLRNRF